MSRKPVLHPNFRRGDVASILAPVTRALLECDWAPEVTNGFWDRRGFLGRLVRVTESPANRAREEQEPVEPRAA